MAHLVACLVTLRAEIDAAWPHRDRTSDGWIGDPAHQLTVSDHNPDARGRVHAVDVDVDGIPAPALVAHLVTSPAARRRLKYVIHDRRIWTRTLAWRPARYNGSNPHITHLHASTDTAHEDDTEPWAVATLIPVPLPPPVRPAGIGTRTLRLTYPYMTGADVAYVQRWIGRRAGPSDGVYGPRTDAAVRWYQRMRGIGVDGIVGPQTWRHMGIGSGRA